MRKKKFPKRVGIIFMSNEVLYTPDWIYRGNAVVHNGTERTVKDTYVVEDPDPYWKNLGRNILLIVFEDGTQQHGVHGIEPVGGRKKRGKK